MIEVLLESIATFNVPNLESTTFSATMTAALPGKLVLMYHSLGSPQQPNVLGSFPIEFSDFQEHLRRFIELGYAIKPSSHLSLTPDADERWLFVTSDDGTVDWSKNALPWCEAENIYTHTAVLTGVWQDNPVYPLAHWIQLLLALRSEQALEILAQRVASLLTVEQQDYVNRIYAYETQPIRRLIKGGCNLILSDSQAREALGVMTNQERDLLEQRFEQIDYLKQFRYAEIGTHSVSHAAMGADIAEYVDEEVKASLQHLIAAGFDASRYFTLPMKPRFGASLQDLTPHLQNLGYQGLFYSAYDDGWDGRSFVIPRLDAKQINPFLQQMLQ